MKKKHYLISWSGGVDSTALLNKLLTEGHRVDAVYSEIKNNTHQTKRELKAIKSMLPYFKSFDTFRYLGSNKITIDVFSDLAFQQVPILMFSLINSAPSYIDSVAIGYVMNDDAISYLSDIEKLWKSYSFLKIKHVKLEFPLMKSKKYSVYTSLPSSLINKVTWCESALDEERCGKCPSCLRMKILINISAGHVDSCLRKNG